jgi:hypothetical protein
MQGLQSIRARRAVGASALAAIVAGLPGCTTGPTLAFTGTWTSQLPQGGAVLFMATQTGSQIRGIVTNFGPVADSVDSVAGSATHQGISIHFSYPANFAGGAPRVLNRWEFNGAFTSATTIVGTITSTTGTTASMTITKDDGPLPL